MPTLMDTITKTVLTVSIMTGLIRTAVAVAPLAQQVLSQSGYSDADNIPGSSSYTAPDGFPTSAFSSYYPTPSGQEPQPAIYDPVLNITYPATLTDPDALPDNDDADPIYYPQPIAKLTLAKQKKVIRDTVENITGILSDSAYSSNCTRCQAALSQAKSAAQLAPSLLPEAMVSLCTSTGFDSAEGCSETYRASTYSAIYVQVLALTDVSGQDGQYICNHLSSKFCDRPFTNALNATDWFPKPKPADCHARVPKDSGKRVKVAHLSDFHLDPRYKVSSEGNCTSGLCCRSNVDNSNIAPDVSLPASPWGYYQCDTPYDLGLSALQAVGPLTGTSTSNPLAWTIYTGDLVSHDPLNELSRLYVDYAETSIYSMFKIWLTGPVFPTLGNHDTNPEAIDAPHAMPGNLSQQMSWNYHHVSSLWKHEGWISEAAAAQARTHYGAYSIKVPSSNLRIITFNSDFWYRGNLLNYINTTNPDVSGTFKFMIDELQAAEDAGERVWIAAHVLSGWDGSNPMPNPTDLFYQIVDRYSPHVIANVFFGHTHEDQQMIYYANNGTVRSRETALTPGWIGPSVTPLTNLNSGFRMYEVDPHTGEIWDAYTFIFDVSSYPSLANTSHGPIWELEYSTRSAYGPAAGWPETAPLNATFWHAVTEAMEADHGLVELFNKYEGKSSVKSPNCTDAACASAKVCYIRSGSVALGRECQQGYGSVQSAFEPAGA